MQMPDFCFAFYPNCGYSQEFEFKGSVGEYLDNDFYIFACSCIQIFP